MGLDRDKTFETAGNILSFPVNSGVYKKIYRVIKRDGFGAFFLKSVKKAKSLLFTSNSATWFKKDLTKPITQVRMDADLTVNFIPRARIINWIIENSKTFPWILVEKEANTGIMDNHMYPFVTYRGAIIGYVKIGFNRVYIQDYDRVINLPPKEAFIYDTFMLPEFRRRHISLFLVTRASRYLQMHGYRKVWCHIPQWNTASAALYTRAGFKDATYIKFTRFIMLKFFNVNPEKMLFKNTIS